MAVDTVQISPINIQHRLAQIELQLQRHSVFAGSSVSAFSAVSDMCSHWILDSGASYHMTSNSTILSSIIPLPSHFLPLHIANGSQLAITQTWSITSLTLNLPLVLHIQHLCMNLISISSLCEIGLIITFDYFTLRSYYTSRSCLSSSSCYIWSQTGSTSLIWVFPTGPCIVWFSARAQWQVFRTIFVSAHRMISKRVFRITLFVRTSPACSSLVVR